ncbi:MAG TPA: SMC family ATPase, partial [Pseudothermotoga sp.]
CKVDFKEGVFLILGQNGAGKSSLLEAIVFALYGTGIRYGKKSPQDYMRSSTSTCQVKLSFLKNGKKYEVFRRIRSSGTEALLTENDAIIATQRTHVDRELQRILDTTYESFISTFFLPQGRATYLLTAKRSEINDIVFDVLFPKKILRSVQEKVSEIVKNLQMEHEKMQARLGDLRIRSEQILGTANPEKIDLCNRKLKDLQEQIESTEQKLKSIEQERIFWQQIRQIEKNLKDLVYEKNRLIFEAEEERKINLAKSIGGDYQILSAIREKFELSQKQQNSIQEQIKKYENDILKAKRDLENLERNRSEIEQNINKLNTEREKLQKIDLQSEPFLNNLNQLKTMKSFLEKEKLNLKSNISKIEKQISEKQSALMGITNSLQLLQKEFDEIKQQTVIWMSQEIAQNLQDGDTCPVCGNVFHKITVTRQKADVQRYHELKQSIEEEQRQIERLIFEIKSLSQERDSTNERMNQISKDLDDCVDKIGKIENELQIMGYDSSIKQKINEFSKEIEYLLGKKGQVQSSISKLAESKEQLNKRIDELSKDLQSLSSQIEKLQIELHESEKIFSEKLGKTGLTFKEFEIYSKKELPSRSNLEMLQRIELQIEKNHEELDKLKNSVSLEYEVCENNYRKLINELEAIKKHRDEYIRQKAIIEHLLEELKNIEEQKENLQKEFETIHREYQIASSVKDTLSAREFQSFVTNMVLDEIIARTNNMPDTLTDGRFKIKINEMGFSIVDGNTDRSADGLSGGEKTIVSLALAIAIAETATGQMELFFIDEGFSALDEENKSRIASALKQMEKLNKVIGFVTHDPQFAEYFDRKLIVEKGGVVKWI